MSKSFPEIIIPQKQRQILLDLFRSKKEIKERIGLVMTTIIAGHGIDESAVYQTNGDATKLVLMQAVEPGAKIGNLKEKKSQYNASKEG